MGVTGWIEILSRRWLVEPHNYGLGNGVRCPVGATSLATKT